MTLHFLTNNREDVHPAKVRRKNRIQKFPFWKNKIIISCYFLTEIY